MSPKRGGPYESVKRCRGRCARVLPMSAYHIDNEASDGRQAYCPRCKADNTREARWLKEYGLRPGRAQRCLELQGNICPLCGEHLDFSIQPAHWRHLTLCVDHDHSSGEVRGLVHSHCNLRPPADGLASRRWLSYCSDPPMRFAHDGRPLLAPISGAGDAQMVLAVLEPPADIGPRRRAARPQGHRVERA